MSVERNDEAVSERDQSEVCQTRRRLLWTAIATLPLVLTVSADISRTHAQQLVTGDDDFTSMYGGGKDQDKDIDGAKDTDTSPDGDKDKDTL